MEGQRPQPYSNPNNPNFQVVINALYSEVAKDIKWLVENARVELEDNPRQAFEKIFLLWKKLLAITFLYVLPTHVNYLNNLKTSRNILQRLVQKGQLIVTTSEAPRLLKELLRLCENTQCRNEVTTALETLKKTYEDVYKLHIAFYEGPENAGLWDMDNARRVSAEILRELEKMLMNQFFH